MMFQRAKRSSAAHTLLELIMATSIIAATLVPALRLMRDGMSQSRELDRRNMMTNYCVSKLEEQLAVVASQWSRGNGSGDFANDSHPDIRFLAQRSDDAVDGGITDRLMSIIVTVYDDADQDDTLDTPERRVVFRTKIARLATYEYEAGS